MYAWHRFENSTFHSSRNEYWFKYRFASVLPVYAVHFHTFSHITNVNFCDYISFSFVRLMRLEIFIEMFWHWEKEWKREKSPNEKKKWKFSKISNCATFSKTLQKKRFNCLQIVQKAQSAWYGKYVRQFAWNIRPKKKPHSQFTIFSGLIHSINSISMHYVHSLTPSPSLYIISFNFYCHSFQTKTSSFFYIYICFKI